ncbi:NAD(P)/FAD-dependent oxidoreductase [Phanerochaete sordida]|uniref:NAD(P)/FAD-dependent oxidoreductase n=1 Tax=Phanerochaete sordida TaxID=48140 RepID=A0A9P3LBM2_9APHY|nr:NAD(P)/FAD-dependent oxidoreductase [Phanerochaete sordida]
MSTESAPPKPALPTFAHLGATPPEDIDAQAIARNWVECLALVVAHNDVSELESSLLHPDAWWRDLWALTWDLRTFHGRAAISTFLHDRLALSGFADVTFAKAFLQKPFPDVAWILVHFSFSTSTGTGRGTARLVFGPDGLWRAFTVSTQLDALKGHPELLGAAHRDLSVEQGDWVERRRRELAFEKDPEVLVIGAGQAGLEVAARLKHFGVSHLIIERNDRVGDNWRKRYDRLTLHDPIWANNLPYLPFPDSWPAFPSAAKVANWLEFYAEALELNTWLSTEAAHAARNEQTGKWDVTVRRADGTERTLHVDHVVLGQGFTFKKTLFPGQDDFKGRILHSHEFKSAKDFVGKKVVIIGACTSAHDISSDCADYGVDVTMVQRTATYVLSISKGITYLVPSADWEHTPVDELELTNHSIPLNFMWTLGTRLAAHVRELDRETLDGLTRAGYSLRNGKPDDCGVYKLFCERGGGYYIDGGACQKIIDGKIKIKSGVAVERITASGVAFADGSELPADVIIVATGFDDARVPIVNLVGKEVGAKIPPVWGLNAEGELRGPWRELDGLPNMWLMMGNFAWCRFYSKFVALQIKAKQEGLYGTRYAAPVEW